MLEGDLALGHLLRRAGFGPAPAEMEGWRKLGYAGAVDRLLAELAEPPPADPEGFDPYVPGAIQQAWLDRMISGRAMLAEKLAFFWHGHFATSDAKIQEPLLMWRQYRLFRSAGPLPFPALLLEVSRDVAMIRWLDGNANRRGAPNENYARELQELFSLGIGNYTEADIREAARAFTGWGSRHHEFAYSPEFHDDGEKTFHGVSGKLGGEDIVRIVSSQPACHRFLAGKLLRFFCCPAPAEAEVAAIAGILESTGGDLRTALRAIFTSPGFLAEERRRCLVSSPVEFVVGALRAVGAAAMPLWAHGALERMGQILFRPPSVKGWTSGTGWLGSAAMVERLKAARRIAEAQPAAAAWIADTAFDGAVPGVIAAEFDAARDAAKVALALASPEYQLG